MIFNQTPTVSFTVVDSAVTPLKAVKEENVWHPLKNLVLDKKFKKVIYV